MELIPQTGIFRSLDSPAIAIGGVEDHVHVFSSLSKNHALQKVVRDVKSGSSKWMKTADVAGNQDFEWQGDYSAFSVSESNAADVQRYIQNEEERHRTMSFQQELRQMFERHGIEFDERYVWD